MLISSPPSGPCSFSQSSPVVGMQRPSPCGLRWPTRVDLRQVARLAGERIVGRRRAVVVQAQHLAAVQHRVLRAVLLLALADGEIQLAVAAEHHAAAEIRRRVAPVLGDEDLLDVLQRLAVEPRARERRRREVALAAFRIRQIQDSVLREARMRQHLEQPAEHRDRAPRARRRSAPGRARRCETRASAPAAP